jgi:tetratricopeptide (TPR) repeat protein
MPDQPLHETVRRSLLSGEHAGDALALLDRDRTNAQAWADVGFLLADCGRMDDAVRHFDRALELDQGCVAAWIGKGMRLSGQAALACFDQATQHQPNSDGAWFLKSVVLEDLGRSAEAADCRAHVLASHGSGVR